jgi:hypothetical protein
MSIRDHADWSAIRACFYLEQVSRHVLAIGPRRSRIRIEVEPTPDVPAERLLALEMPCVCCGKTIAPIRSRHKDSDRRPKRGMAKPNLYFAATCPLEWNMGCSRGSEASAEYEAVRKDLEGTHP